MRGQADYAPRDIGGHFLGDLKLQTAQFEAVSPGNERHGCGYACAERSSHQVGGRKSLTATLIVARGIGRKIAAGRTVGCGAMEIALIFTGDFDHRVDLPFWLFCGAKQRHKRQKSRKGEIPV
jgi:hypothetical protein